MMPNLPPKTIIGKIPCACCGKPANLTINRNGIAYYFCQWSDDQGNSCSYHGRYGRHQTNLMARKYLEQRAANKNAAPVANENAAPVANENAAPVANENAAPSNPQKTGRTGLYEALTGG